MRGHTAQGWSDSSFRKVRPRGPKLSNHKTDIQLLLTLCLLQSILSISFPTQSLVRVQIYVIKHQFVLFSHHFLLMYDKTTGLIGLFLLIIGIFHDIIRLFYSDVSLFFGSLLMIRNVRPGFSYGTVSPSGTSHRNRFVKLPVYLPMLLACNLPFCVRFACRCVLFF